VRLDAVPPGAFAAAVALYVANGERYAEGLRRLV